jgi:hypothetical protein
MVAPSTRFFGTPCQDVMLQRKLGGPSTTIRCSAFRESVGYTRETRPVGEPVRPRRLPCARQPSFGERRSRLWYLRVRPNPGARLPAAQRGPDGALHRCCAGCSGRLVGPAFQRSARPDCSRTGVESRRGEQKQVAAVVRERQPPRDCRRENCDCFARRAAVELILPLGRRCRSEEVSSRSLLALGFTR